MDVDAVSLLLCVCVSKERVKVERISHFNPSADARQSTERSSTEAETAEPRKG